MKTGESSSCSLNTTWSSSRDLTDSRRRVQTTSWFPANTEAVVPRSSPGLQLVVRAAIEGPQVSQVSDRVHALVAYVARPERLLLRSRFAFVSPIRVRHLPGA